MNKDNKLWPLCARCVRKVERFTVVEGSPSFVFRAECHGEVEECEVDAGLARDLLSSGEVGARLRPDRAFPSIAFEVRP